MKQNERRGPGARGPLLHERTHGSGGARPADVRVVIHISDVLGPPASPESRQPISRPARGPRFRRWGVEQPGTSYPFRVESDTPAPDASSAGEALRAVLALAAGLTLAVLSYAQFRGGRGELPVYELTAVLAPDSALEPSVEPAVDAPDVVDAVVAPSTQPRRASAPRARVRAAALPLAARAASGIPEVVESRAAAATVDTPLPPPATIDVDEPAAAPVATMTAAAAVADAVPGDEHHIRAALTRWRSAYSALDARAAREVWPSVDVRALERAFNALRSQEVRFDRCDLTVNGGSALAACTGRAIYVPRVGRQSPRTTSREWTFELKKSDERWTIASARSS